MLPACRESCIESRRPPGENGLAMKKSSIALILIAGIFLPFSAKAQQPSRKIPVIISCNCEDEIGRRFASAIRDLLASSPRYYLVDDTAANRKSSFSISLVSLVTDKDTSDQPIADAFSTVFLVNGYFLDQAVQTCGRDKVESCTKSTLSDLDSIIEKAKEANSK